MTNVEPKCPLAFLLGAIRAELTDAERELDRNGSTAPTLVRLRLRRVEALIDRAEEHCGEEP